MVGSRNRSKLEVIGLVLLVLILGFACFQYRQYAEAVAWHTLHGRYAMLAGRKVTLPLLWWPQHDNESGVSTLGRACPADTILRPEIVARPNILGETADTDQSELESAQDIVKMKNQNSPLYPHSTVVTLKSKFHTLNCTKEDATAFGNSLGAFLTCYAANSPYAFSYHGHPMHEKEAEQILSSLE